MVLLSLSGSTKSQAKPQSMTLPSTRFKNTSSLPDKTSLSGWGTDKPFSMLPYQFYKHTHHLIATPLRMYGVASGKKHTVIKVPSSDEGSVIKVTLDPSGLYVAASITDKSVLLFDVYMGDCIAKICGHSGWCQNTSTIFP